MMEPEHRTLAPDDPRRHVPASVRDPSRQRFNVRVPDIVDEDDEDLDMLAELAQEADRAAQSAPTPRVGRASRFEVSADDQLDVFREARPQRLRPRVLEALSIEEVDIDDLVDQLATTAAALRQRRAA
jgi:hypothetical protein